MIIDIYNNNLCDINAQQYYCLAQCYDKSIQEHRYKQLKSL